MSKYSIEIVNLRRVASADFKCDRSTPLGNPFLMHGTNGRDYVCNRYEDYFNHSVIFGNTDIAVTMYLNEIISMAKEQDITLGCWCVPERCHVETIKKYVEEQLKL